LRLLIIQNSSRCELTSFQLCAQFLQARSERFDLPLLAREGRFLFFESGDALDELIK
jgi:hypothetical protein